MKNEFDKFIPVIIIMVVFFLIGFTCGIIFDSTSKDKLDVQAMRFACIDAGFYDLSLSNNVDGSPDYYFRANDNYANADSKYFKDYCVSGTGKENRVALVNGKYIVQTKKQKQEWEWK